MKKMKPTGEVMLFLPDLQIGGAERAVVNLLQNWPPQLRMRGLLPTIVLRRYTGGLCEQVPSWVEVVSLNVPGEGLWLILATLWKLAMLMRRRRPRAIVAFHTGSFVWVIIASRLGSPQTKIAVSVNNPPSQLLNKPPSRLFGGRHRRAFVSLTSKLADEFWAVIPAIAEETHSIFGIPKRKITVLPSSVDLDKIIASGKVRVSHPAFERKDPVIITGGRLTSQKRVDILLQAASLLAARIEFNLVILGVGPLMDDLERLASTLGIGNRTFFLGFVPNPWAYISKASVFVLSSDYEGFGNVLIEAMACGVPVIATRAPYGAEYIISNEENGLLVPPHDPEALANGIQRLLLDRELRQLCIDAGFKRASDFRVEKVAQSFCVVLKDLIKQ